jgi:hypothetical protein
MWMYAWYVVLLAIKNRTATPRCEIRCHTIALGKAYQLEADFSTRIAQPRRVTQAYSHDTFSIGAGVYVAGALRVTRNERGTQN